MQKISWNKTTIYLGLLILISAGIRLFYAWQPLPDLLMQGMADDAFYYLNVARNLARGMGSSFDGLFTTNGYHPLYVLILLPFFKALPSASENAPQLGLSILMLFNLITVLPLYGSIARLSNRKAGLFAALLWLFNPWALIFSLGGVESAIYVFFVALSVYLYILLQSAKDGQQYTWAAGLGLCLGLTILARSDGIFLLCAVLLEGAARSFWKGPPGLHLFERRWLIQALLIMGVCGLVLAPWLMWNLVTFGYPSQVSGLAVYWQTHFGAITPIERWSRLLQSTQRMALGSLYFSAQSVLVCLLIVSVRLVLRKRNGFTTETQRSPSNLNAKNPRVRSLPPSRDVSAVNIWMLGQTQEISLRSRTLWVMGLYAFQVFAFYAFYLWQEQFWYFMPVLYTATIFGGIFFAMLGETCASYPLQFQRFINSVSIVEVLLVGCVAWLSWHNGWLQLYPAQRNALWIAEQLSARTEPGDRIGAWNSGILGYLSDRTVINLDGVVNNGLYRYVRQRDASFFDLCALWEYIQANKIDYLTDYQDAWSGNLEPFINGRLVLWAETKSVPEAGNYMVRIYHVMMDPEPLAEPSCPGAITLYK